MGGLALILAGLALIFVPDILLSDSAFSPNLVLRYQRQRAAGEFVLLEIAPFQVGRNIFRVTVLDKAGQPLKVEPAALRFSRLASEGVLAEIEGLPDADGPSFRAEYPLSGPGWWAIEVAVDGKDTARFYLRLDNPSQAPLAFAPPDYESDPMAEGLFREAVTRYEGLSSLKWREELTSGLSAPTAIGAWVLTHGEAEVPDKTHFVTLSADSRRLELYRIGAQSCGREQSGAWQCSGGRSSNAFDLDYQRPATAFRLGGQELVDGELVQVLFFYNPTQPAWYAWWVGKETGYLRQQVMVAPGHFMVTHFFDHNVPVDISFPAQIQQAKRLTPGPMRGRYALG